jgi:putative transcriptional regulator
MKKTQYLLISDFSDINGKFLIATPHNSLNELFKKSVIYVAVCNSDYCIGIIINQKIDNLTLSSLENIFFTKNDLGIYNDSPILLGGPEEDTKGLILHSSEYGKNVLFRHKKFSISSNPDIIKNIAEGTGPQKTLFVLGYTYWHKNQIEEEFKNNYWIVSEADDELLFSQEIKNKWEKSLEKAGIDYTMFSNSSSIS